MIKVEMVMSQGMLIMIEIGVYFDVQFECIIK